MDDNPGIVTIAPNVLVTIVQKTAATVPGIAQLADGVPGAKRFFGRQTVGKGVEVDVVDDQVRVDIHLIAKRDVDLYQMGRQLQREVTRAIEDIVGMQVREVNVHIEDVQTDLALDKDKDEG